MIDEVRALLTSARLHVWVLEFGLTHHTLRLAVHAGDYPRHTEVVCRDCVSFYGRFQGGPYALELLEDGQGNVRIMADGNLMLECGLVKIGKVRR